LSFVAVVTIFPIFSSLSVPPMSRGFFWTGPILAPHPGVPLSGPCPVFLPRTLLFSLFSFRGFHICVGGHLHHFGGSYPLFRYRACHIAPQVGFSSRFSPKSVSPNDCHPLALFAPELFESPPLSTFAPSYIQPQLLYLCISLSPVSQPWCLPPLSPFSVLFGPTRHLFCHLALSKAKPIFLSCILLLSFPCDRFHGLLPWCPLGAPPFFFVAYYVPHSGGLESLAPVMAEISRFFVHHPCSDSAPFCDFPHLLTIPGLGSSPFWSPQVGGVFNSFFSCTFEFQKFFCFMVGLSRYNFRCENAILPSPPPTFTIVDLLFRYPPPGYSFMAFPFAPQHQTV